MPFLMNKEILSKRKIMLLNYWNFSHLLIQQRVLLMV